MASRPDEHRSHTWTATRGRQQQAFRTAPFEVCGVFSIEGVHIEATFLSCEHAIETRLWLSSACVANVNKRASAGAAAVLAASVVPR